MQQIQDKLRQGGRIDLLCNVSGRREDALLRLCARPEVTAEVVDTADQLLSAEIDWTYLIRTGYQHRLIPLVDRLLHLVGEHKVPGDILHALRYRTEKDSERSQYLANEWCELSRSLASSPMHTPILINGPPLTERLHGDVSFSQPSVQVFFVRDGDSLLANEVLSSRGFRKQPPTEAAEDSGSPLASSDCYQRVKDRMTLEVHSLRSFDDSSMRVLNETLWLKAATWKYQDSEMLVLDTNDQLIALCLQGARERWRMLQTIADIAHFMHRHREIDFGATLARARTLRCESVSVLGLMLAGWLVAIKQASMLSDASAAERIERRAGEIWHGIFNEGSSNGRAIGTSATGIRAANDRDSTVSHVRFEVAKREAQEHWASRSDVWQRWSDLTLPAMAVLSEKLFDAAGIATGHKVLDLACGPGDTSLLLGPRVGPTGIVVSTDLIPDMVISAAQRARAAKPANLKWAVADMENLPLADQEFDAVVCRLGIMYCPRVGRALREARRMLKPGGRAAFLVCGPVENNHVLAALHDVLWDFFDIRPDSVPAPFRFAQRNSLAPLLEEAGFTSVDEIELRSEKTLPRNFRFWQPGAERAMGWKLDELPPLTRNALEQRMNAALKPCLAGDTYRLSSHYRIGVGTKAS